LEVVYTAILIAVFALVASFAGYRVYKLYEGPR
jgi:hypothetical protein